jgi:hypothetical protein
MPCISTYCISNTGLVGVYDNYITGGTYNGVFINKCQRQ